MTSSDYYNSYLRYRDEVNTLQTKINFLTQKRNILLNNLEYEQVGINYELDILKGDMERAVRHDDKWDSIITNMDLFRQSSSTSDTNIKSAIENLGTQISLLTSEKDTAETSRDCAYREYQDEKEREYQAFLKSLKSMV